MLLLGTALSIVTAVFATRALLGLLAGFHWFDSPKFMGAEAQKMARWQMFDYGRQAEDLVRDLRCRDRLAIVSLVFKGLNLGIDFRGGTQMTFVTAQPVDIADVRAEARKFDLGDAVIQGRGAETDGRFSEFQIRAEPLTARRAGEVATPRRRVRRASRGPERLGELHRADLARAILAMLVSFPLITIYIWAASSGGSRCRSCGRSPRRPDRDRHLLARRARR